MSKFDTIFPPELTCSDDDTDVDARPPENAPRSPALITTTSDVTVEVTDDTIKCPREVESVTKNRPTFTIESDDDKCLENYENVDFDSFGGFFQSSLMCKTMMGDDVSVYIYRYSLHLLKFSTLADQTEGVLFCPCCWKTYVNLHTNLEAVCSNYCQNKYIEAEEKEQKDGLDSTVSEAFMSSFTK